MSLLCYRAGPRALERLRREALSPGTIRAVVGPASGPRWLVLAGLDRALLSTNLLSRGRILLAGASAGAWRMLAYASRDPQSACRRLLDGYIGQAFPKGVTPAEVSRAYRRLVSDVIADDAGHLLDHPVFDLGIHTARCRAGGTRAALLASILAAGALNVATSRATGLFFERVLFHSRPSRFRPAFGGRLLPLGPDNLLAAGLATGTVPIYLEAVRDIPGAPRGAYVDGGLTDYHLRQAYTEAGDGIVLLFHYQRRILPRWLDRFRRSRRPAPEATADLLQIYPSANFAAGLHDAHIPDRQDFQRFIDDPEERIRRWRAVAAASDALGEQFLADLDSGQLADQVLPL